jgi:hypothetical protein
VQLPDALIEELLRLGVLGRDLDVNVSRATHEERLLPRAFVEDLAMHGVARQQCRRLVGRRLFLGRYVRLGGE